MNKFLILALIPLLAILLLPVSSIIAQQEEEEIIQEQQVFINNNIQNITAYGEYKDSNYNKYYKPSNLFDNSIKQDSWWSQYGKSGFTVFLKEPIPKICNIDIEVAQTPQNSPFVLSLGDSKKVFNGSLSSNVVKPDFGEECAENVSNIKMDITESKTKSNKLAELRLFTYVTITPPPPEPVICEPGYSFDVTTQQCVPNEQLPQNITNITISNTKAIMDVSDSELVINLGNNTSVTLPNLEVTAPQVAAGMPKPQLTLEETDEKEDEEDEEDEDDKKD